MISITDTERRALHVLSQGKVEYVVSGSKAADWDKEIWQFNIATLRALKDLGLADYDILASCRRTWYLTQDGRELCGKLQLS